MSNGTGRTRYAANRQAAEKRIVVVGAGQAAVELAASLRQRNFGGSIILVGNEADLPYSRPVLSKDLHPVSRTITPLRAQSFYDSNSIELRLGKVVDRIERDRQVVVLTDGTLLAYDHLVLATGARNRIPAVQGIDISAALQLRTIEDARKLAKRVTEIRHAVIIGGGFIGLEVASLLRGCDVEVMVVEAGTRLLRRMLSPLTSDYFREFHTRAGVRLQLGNTVLTVGRKSNRQIVALSDGTTVNTDAVMMAIGVLPNDTLAAAAGLRIDNGIVVDALLCTSDPSISAIGDCAAFPNPFGDSLVRLESVQNAIDQARCVASRLTGAPAPYRNLPWFWSNQGSLCLQIAGLAADADDVVLRGRLSDNAFSIFLYRGERLIAVESVNKPSEHLVARRILSAGNAVPKSIASDTNTDLKQFASAIPYRAVQIN